MNIVGNDETGMPSSLRPVMRYEHVGNIALVFGQRDALGLVDQNSRSLTITPVVSSRGRRGISVSAPKSGRNPPRIFALNRIEPIPAGSRGRKTVRKRLVNRGIR